MRKVFSVLCCLVFLYVAKPSLSQVENFNLTSLMRVLSQVERIEAHFQEQKTLAILKTPLEYSGTLLYRAPSYIEKRGSNAELFIIDDDWLTIETPEQGRRQYSLEGYRELQPLTAALRGLLSGDLALLQRYYRLNLSGNRDNWTLRLNPIQSNVAELIEHITAYGQNNQITRLDTVESNGDYSSMIIAPH